MSIYTKTGDKGKTTLANKERVSKSHLRIRAVGDADELNSVIGVAAAFCALDHMAEQLTHIQSWLFVVGAELACASKTMVGECGNAQAAALLENWIDEYMERCGQLKSFILPGGNPLCAFLHQARSVCRRLERTVVELHEKEPVHPDLLLFLNRLSDYFFAAAQMAVKTEAK